WGTFERGRTPRKGRPEVPLWPDRSMIRAAPERADHDIIEGVHSMLPTACNMPDLSDLQARSSQGVFLLNQFIGPGKGFPPTMASYRRNMVRLADKAVHDYMDVRNSVLAQI